MLQPGQLLRNRYHILSQLGQGGMGAVYLAHDTTLNVDCVVKELLIPFGASQGTAQGAVQGFQAEAFTLAKLRHPSIPRVTDYFDQGSSYYLVMDFVNGTSLDKLIGQGLSESVVLNYADQLLDVLEYVHDEGVVHRDIKPENVIIRQVDGKAFLVDFGISKTGSMPTIMFAKGMGTPPYAPLEQYSGGTDARSDIYALAATLYELVTGRKAEESMNRQMGAQLVHPRSIKPGLSDSTANAILMGMTLDRNGRFQTAKAFRAALSTKTVPAPPVPPPAPPRSPLMTVIALGALAAILCGVVALFAVLNSASAGRPAPTASMPTAIPASGGPSGPAAAPVVVTVLVTPVPKPVTASATQVPPTSVPVTVTPRPTTVPPPVSKRDTTIGRSAGNRDIRMTEIGYASGSGPVIVLVGQIAGEQGDTRTVVDEAMSYYESLPGNVPAGTLLRFIPSINPDGGGSKRLNDHRVDLNRNWQSFNWRPDAPVPGESTSAGGGNTPFSEPETRALRDLLLDARASGRSPVLIVLHSSANPGKHFVYPGYTREDVDPVSKDLAETAANVIRSGSFAYDDGATSNPTTGEAIAWCAENNIPSIDIFWSRPDGNRPSGRDMAAIIEAISRKIR